MNIFKYFSFSPKIPNNCGGLFAFLIVSTFGWFPSAGVMYFAKNIWDTAFVIAIYGGLILILYLFAGKRVLLKNVKISASIIIISITLQAIQNSVLLYLYAYQFFESMCSLWISILASLIVTMICIELWIQISNKSTMAKND